MSNKSNQKISSIFIKFQRTQTPFYAAGLVLGHQSLVRLRLTRVDKSKDRLFFQPAFEDIGSLRELISGSKMLTIVSEDQFFLGHCPIQELRTSGIIVLGHPQRYQFFERRVHKRICPSMKISAKLTGAYSKVEKEIFDLSEGGFSILLSNVERRQFQEGDEVEVEVLGKDFLFSSKALAIGSYRFSSYQFKDLPFAGEKISFKFEELSEKNRYILEKLILNYGGAKLKP